MAKLRFAVLSALRSEILSWFKVENILVIFLTRFKNLILARFFSRRRFASSRIKTSLNFDRAGRNRRFWRRRRSDRIGRNQIGIHRRNSERIVADKNCSARADDDQRTKSRRTDQNFEPGDAERAKRAAQNCQTGTDFEGRTNDSTRWEFKVLKTFCNLTHAVKMTY